MLDQQRLKAIELLVTGETISSTAELVGVTRSTIYKWKEQDDFKYEMDLDLFVRFYKFKDLKVKMMNVCVMTFRTGGTSSAPAAKMKQERIRLIKENGGNSWDVFVFLGYHQAKYMIKITYWALSKFFKKIFCIK